MEQPPGSCRSAWSCQALEGKRLPPPPAEAHVRGNSDLRSEARAAQSLLERELQVACSPATGPRPTCLSAGAGAGTGRTQDTAAPHFACSTPQALSHLGAVRVSWGPLPDAREAGGRTGLAVQSKVGSPDVALAGRGPLHGPHELRVLPGVGGAALDLAGALGLDYLATHPLPSLRLARGGETPCAFFFRCT